MKLITCRKCGDLVMLVNKITRKCYCGDIAGKYLNDNITAVVNDNAIVVGIDNNGFAIAKHLSTSENEQKLEYRVDRFFTGWIPNHPGEIIRVYSVEEVIEYLYEMEEEDKEFTSTSPVNET